MQQTQTHHVDRIPVVNLFGGTDEDKRRTAQRLSVYLSFEYDLAVELCRSYAQELCAMGFEDNIINNPLRFNGEQIERQSRLVRASGIDVVITPAPIIMGCFYPCNPSFEDLLLDEFEKFHNFNIFVYGDKEESDEDETSNFQVKDFLNYKSIPYERMRIDDSELELALVADDIAATYKRLKAYGI